MEHAANSDRRPDLTDIAEGLPPFLDPSDVQRRLKLSSRRAARELIVREMDHIVVGRTPMTTTDWLADWVACQRRAPRRPAPPAGAPVVSLPVTRRAAPPRHRPAMPPPRRRAKGA